jgi:hypothetical protein
MFGDTVSFGVDPEEGSPYVDTYRGRIRFATIEQAAEFVQDHARTQLCAQASVWDSFETTLERHGGHLRERHSLVPLSYDPLRSR